MQRFYEIYDALMFGLIVYFYIFKSNTILAFPNYLFTQQKYLETNTGKSVCLDFGKAKINFHVKEGIAYCPYQSSFSVFQGGINHAVVAAFILKLKGKVDSIHFGLPPLHYPSSQQHLDALTQNGFKVKRVEVAQIRSLQEEFQKGLSSSKKNKLNQLLKSNIETKKLGIEYFDACYQLILQNRNKKGYKMTISKDKLQQLLTAFPSDFWLYGTFYNGTLVACSVTIAVSETIIYQFIWAHDHEFADISPLLYHNYDIHCNMKSEGYEIIDYGVCSLEGVINRGNYQFKKELGAFCSKKYYLEYIY